MTRPTLPRGLALALHATIRPVVLDADPDPWWDTGDRRADAMLERLGNAETRAIEAEIAAFVEDENRVTAPMGGAWKVAT